MSKTCKLEYLDNNGNLSADYYGNLHLGHEAALKIYLDRNKNAALTKFQKGKSEDELIEMSELIKQQMKESKSGNENVFSPSRLIKNYSSDFNSESVAEDLAKFQVAQELLSDNITELEKFGYDSSRIIEIKRDLKQSSKGYAKINRDVDARLFSNVDLWVSKNKTKFDAKVKDILAKWEAKRLEGERIHEVVENFFNIYKKLQPDEDGNLDYNSVIEETIKISNKRDVEESMQLLKDLLEFMKTNFKDPSKLTILPEFAIESKSLNLRGIADLVILDDKNNAYIFDTKTKELNKDYQFTIENKRMPGILGNLYDNKFEHVSLQTTVYQMILEEMGYNVQPSKVLYVEGDMERVTGQYRYKNLKLGNKKKPITLESRKREINSILTEKNVINKLNSRTKEAGKVNDINEALTDLTGEFLDPAFKGKKLERVIANTLDRVKVDEETGREFFYSKLSENGKEYFKSKDKEGRVEQLKSYFEQLEEHNDELANRFVKYANNQTTIPYNGSKKSAIQARNILKGLSSEEYTFTKLREISGFEDYHPTIILATNKINGEGHIITLNSSSNYIEESESKYGRRNIFREHVSDLTFSKIAGPGLESLEYTADNLQLIRGGAIALDLYNLGRIKSVGKITVGLINGSDREPLVSGANIIMPHLRVMKQILKSKNSMSNDFESLLDDKLLQDPKNLKFDSVQTLVDLIDSGYEFNMDKKEVEQLQKNCLDFQTHPLSSKGPLMDRLVSTFNNLAETLHKNYEGKEELIKEDLEYRLISNLILDINDMHLTAGEITNNATVESLFRTTSTINETAIKYLESEIQKRDRIINQEMSKFEAKKEKVIEDLKKLYGNKFGANDRTDIFSNLWKVDPNNRDKNRVDDFYVLKDESEVSASEEKAFIRFFNETILRSFELSLSPEEFELVKQNKSWKKGAIPAMHASMINQIVNEKDTKKKLSLALKSTVKSSRQSVKDNVKDLHKVFKNDVNNQLGEGKRQHNANRRELLGIDANGELIETKVKLETNLEAIMQTMLLKGLSVYNHSKTMAVYNSLSTIAFLEENENFRATEKTREFMSGLVKLKIFNQQDEEGKAAKAADKIKKGASVAAFGLSLKQFILEGATNFFGTGSSVITQALMGKEKRFNPGDWIKAGAFLAADSSNTVKNRGVVHALTRSLGLYNGDPTSWTKKEKLSTRRNGFFQSKWMYFLNSLPFKFFKTQMIISELYNKGIINSLSTDEEGNLIYDPSKDERFKGIVNAKGEIKNNLNEEEKKKAALYEAFVKDSTEDGNIDENGIPTSPITLKELASMQNYALSVYGSVDNDAKVNANLKVLGRMFLTYKSWFIAKKDTYWTPSQISKVRGGYKWVEDPDLPYGGEMHFEYESVEGILQTLQYIGNSTLESFKNKEFNIKEGFSNLSRNQRENLTKLMVDIAIVSALAAALGAAMDDEDGLLGSGFGKSTGKVLLNGVGDLNFFSTSGSLLGNTSPTAAFSLAWRSLNNLTSGIALMVEGDNEKGAQKLTRVLGATKIFDY